MKILVIGGNRYMGYHLTWRLILAGHSVTVVNRSNNEMFVGRVNCIRADRRTDDFNTMLRGHSFDAVIDFAAFNHEDIAGLLRTFPPGSIGHYIFVSSGQVYLVRQDCPSPSEEVHYRGPVMDTPPSPEDAPDWEYGIGKRNAEDALDEAFETLGYPATRLRIPIVIGERDPQMRVQRYLLRLLDGGPLLLRDGGTKLIRPVYAPDVARAIEAMIGNCVTFGKAYNFAQEDVVSVYEAVKGMADVIGVRLSVVGVTEEEAFRFGLSLKHISPFDGRWTSMLNPTRAKQDLNLQHQPFQSVLERIVSCTMNVGLVEPPEFREHRRDEVQLARSSRG